MNNIPRISAELNARLNQDGFSTNSNGLSGQLNQPSLNPRLKSWRQRQQSRQGIIGGYQQSQIARSTTPIRSQALQGEQITPSTGSILNKTSYERPTASSTPTEKPARYRFNEPKSRRNR